MESPARFVHAHPLAQGFAPDWASAWGEDEHGVWIAFDFNGVEERLRWIPPGTFWMGTPAEEQGRYGDEGPRHRVTITEGFWLGEAPVTQELWEAVMGKNLSHFQSARRPVEQVSWEDVQAFLQEANRAQPKLKLRLPLECEWEYACRAGTEGATYAGEMEIRGLNNAPVLEEIAWYGGNSAEGFELENGVDNSDWNDKSGRDGKAGTHAVGEKRANPWGLHDMLGNVWEWCRDGQRTYSAQAVIDPRGPGGANVLRVRRGGAWDSPARTVRAGYRRADHPSPRWLGLGFRLARGPGALGQDERRAEPGEGEPRSGSRGTRRGGSRDVSL